MQIYLYKQMRRYSRRNIPGMLSYMKWQQRSGNDVPRSEVYMFLKSVPCDFAFVICYIAFYFKPKFTVDKNNQKYRTINSMNMVIWFLDFIHRPVFKRIKAIKTQCFGDWICLCPQWLRLALSNGPNWIGLPCPIQLRTETDPVSETLCFYCFYSFEHWTMDRVQKPNNHVHLIRFYCSNYNSYSLVLKLKTLIQTLLLQFNLLYVKLVK
jgi:hypothetical protein